MVGPPPFVYSWRSGEGSSPSDVSEYSTTEHGTFGNPNLEDTTWFAPSPDGDQDYVVSLRVTDTYGRVSGDYFVASVNYPQPTAVILTEPTSIVAGSPFILRARIDGGSPPVTGRWSTSTPSVSFFYAPANPDNTPVTYTGPAPASALPITIYLQAEDARGRRHTDSVVLTVLAAGQGPSVSITTSEMTVDSGTTISMMATSENAASHEWSSDVAGGVFVNRFARNTTWIAPSLIAQQRFALSLTVVDSNGVTAVDTVNITVRARDGLVVVNTLDQTVRPGSIVSLDADSSGGGGRLFQWSMTPSGGTFESARMEDTIWTAPEEITGDTVYILTLTVTDGANMSSDNVIITVSETASISVSNLNVPGPPQSLSVIRVNSTSFRAAWLPPVRRGGSLILGYYIRYRVGSYGPWQTAGYVSSPHTVINLIPGSTYQVEARAENGFGPGEWSLLPVTVNLSTATPTASTPVRSSSPEHRLGNYIVEADWNRDGNYNHPLSDISDYLLSQTLETKTGRNYRSQKFGRTVAGTTSLTVRNEGGEFDRFNPSSPLYNFDIDGTPIRIRMEDVDLSGVFRSLWSGRIDKSNPDIKNSGQNKMVFSCNDIIVELQEAKDISIPYSEYVTSPNAVNTILDKANIGVERRGRIGGDFTLPRWWTNSQTALKSLRDIEETEGGFIKIDADNRIEFEGSTYRAQAFSRISRLNISVAESDITDIKPEDPLRDVVNFVTVPIRQFSTTDSTELWRLPEGGALRLEPGEERVYVAEYPTGDSPRSHLLVEEWIDMEAGNDFQANSQESGEGDDLTGSLLITTDDGSTTRRIVAENIHPTETMYVIVLKSRGRVIVEERKASIEIKDQSSIDKFERIDHESPTQYLATPDQAHEYGSHIVSRYSRPQTKIDVRFQINHDLSIAYTLFLSDRITLMRGGVTEDYFIEHVGHCIDPGLRHDMKLTLSPAESYDSVMILGLGPPLGQATLGR